MEVLIDACDEAGYRTQGEDGRWWLDRQGLESAFATYALRVAPVQEEDYFTFSNVAETDAVDIPRLMARAEPPSCTLMVSSVPSERLVQGNVTITCVQPPLLVAKQDAGVEALTRLRQQVTPWMYYDVRAEYPEETKVQRQFAQPPFAQAKLT